MNKQRMGKFAAGIMMVVVISTPFFAGAVSVADLQKQLTGVLSQIAQIQGSTQSGASVSDDRAQARVRPEHRVCSLLSRNLYRGTRGDDVLSLQEFLREEGYLSANATGFYGSLTSAAVSKWQAAQGLSSVGAFGPLSRARLSEHCGNVSANAQRFDVSPLSGKAPLSVSFGTWLSGFRVNTVYYTIDFGDGSSERAADCNAPADACISPGVNTHTYTAEGTYTATLNMITDPCAGNPQCKAAIRTEMVAKETIKVGATVSSCKPINYMPIACADGSQAQPTRDENGCMTGYECPVANYTPPASCKVWSDGCNTCSRSSADSPAACTLRYCFAAGKGYCSVYFDKTPTSANKAPVISGISGPATLSVGGDGTWSVKATDPENGSLSYDISWGDEKSYAPSMSAMLAERNFVQTTTFTHAYAVAGTYTVTITVRDTAGLTAQTSSSVKVGTDSVACTLQYAPVCGQPPMPYCAPGMMCAQMMPAPKTYGNACELNAAGATLLYQGACSNGL